MLMPMPECELGYPTSQVEQIMGEKTKEFWWWMGGQTMSICDGRKYNYKTEKHEDTGCGPHGSIVYVWDAERFLAGRPIVD